MQATSDSEACVKWGSDKGYSEPIVRVDDIPLTASLIPAIEAVAALTLNKQSPSYRLCSSLQMVMSR